MTNVDTKAIIVIGVDGTEREIPAHPDFKTMETILDDWIEWVRVLREDLPGFEYTWMVVGETGRMKGKPVNEKATHIYHANVKRQFPDAENPHLAAVEDWERQIAARIGKMPPIFYSHPKGEAPPICGPAIWWRGYTCDEIEAAGVR